MLFSVSLGCGMTTNENCTYFESGQTAVVPGPCRLEVRNVNS